MAKTMPPFDVESSLVRTIPVRPTASWKATAWVEAVLAGRRIEDEHVSGTAPGSRLSMMRRIFESSSIRFDFVCRRPAVSAITRSAPRATAASSAS